MRSVVLSLALLATSVMAVPKPGAECVTKGNTVIEFEDVTLTKTVYVTEGSVPEQTYAPAPQTTKRKKHSHKPKPTPAAYTPAPAPEYNYAPPQPTPEYVPPKVEEKPKPVENSPAPVENKPITGSDKEIYVNAHNFVRNQYQDCPSLSWDDNLASIAQNHANNLRSNGCGLVHNQNRQGNGENLYSSSGNSVALGAVISWANEQGSYSYNNPGFSGSTGHFTQVVWKGTQRLGCGSASCGGSTVVVCNYAPAGNFLGQFEDQIPYLKPGVSYTSPK